MTHHHYHHKLKTKLYVLLFVWLSCSVRENKLLEDVEMRRQEGVTEINLTIEKKAAKHSER